MNIFKCFNPKLTNAEKSLILPVTIGSQFEWFEFFLFIYWSKIFEKKDYLSGFSASIEEIVYAMLLLFTGLFARPIGGIIFGRMGDKIGRKKTFIRSISWIILPSFILTITPSFPTYTYSSLIYLGIMRLLQGIPAGGELPGALCLLYEGVKPSRRQYICSYLFVGTQLGQILSLLMIFILQACLTYDQLLSWGWRLSFGISTTIGFLGGLLSHRLFRKLIDSEEFKDLEKERKIESHPLKKSFNNYSKRIFLVLFLSIFEVSGFYLVYYYLFEKPHLLRLNPFHGKIVYLAYLCILTIIMPILGSMKYQGLKIESLFRKSAVGVMIFSIPFFFAIQKEWPSPVIFLLLSIMILFFCIQFSFLPSFIAGVFPIGVRFTCIGFSFNITDGVLGGMIPLFSSWFTRTTGEEAAFIGLFPVTALIFLICLFFLNKERHSYGH